MKIFSRGFVKSEGAHYEIQTGGYDRPSLRPRLSRYAYENACDMVVMGQRGKSTIGKMDARLRLETRCNTCRMYCYYC